MELIDTWNIDRYICKVMHKARIITLTCFLSKKYTNSSPYFLFLIICPMYSYVLYYNIEKSGFNAVSASLVFFQLTSDDSDFL